MAIVCTGNGRDKELINIVTHIVAWTMYNFLLEHNVTGNSIKAAMTAWFPKIHKTVAIYYSEYEQDSGKVLFQDTIDSKEIGSES